MIRSVIHLTSVGFGLMLLFLLCGIVFKPALQDIAVDYPEDYVEEIVTQRDPKFDSEQLPAVQIEVDYSEGESADWYPKGESPILAELVKEGELPPVEERVGSEPLVLDGIDGIGNYGGTWHRVANSPGDTNVMTFRLGGTLLVRWSPMGYPIRPHIAKGWSVSDDNREWTFYLRKGSRWSDGHPVTVDDIIYWWEKEIIALEYQMPIWMQPSGKPGTIEKVDDHTVVFRFPEPNGTFLEGLATNGKVLSPKHYLEQYHPIDGNQELIEAAKKATGIDLARTVYSTLTNYRNPELPSLSPWIYQTYQTTPPESFVRNPYFFAVDAEGNQLPYVDRILFEVKSPKLIPIAAANGEITMQGRSLNFTDYTLLMENRERGDYEVYHWFNATRSNFTLWPNINRRVFPGDSESKWKAELLQNKNFRKALSIAINRQEIVDALYGGFGEPSQLEPGPSSDFHDPELGKSYTAFDPERANQMLDEIGLAERDSEGMRTFPDGSRMTWYLDFTGAIGEGPLQFIVDDWERVGVRAIHRERSRPLFAKEKSGLLHDFTVWYGESEFNPVVQPRSFVPVNTESHFAPAYGRWYEEGGMYGSEGDEFGGKEPPEGGPIRQAMLLLEEVKKIRDTEQQVELFRKIFDINKENLWSISISTPPPSLMVVKNGFRNVPKVVANGYAYGTPYNAGIETFFFEEPYDSPAAISQIKSEMITVTPPSTAIDLETLESRNSGGIGSLLLTLLALVCVALLILVAVQHPYIGRRLLIMIPTLGIVSVVTFTIIQLPPGDYVETRILELQLSGDQAAIEEVERIREAFYFDEPMWKRYFRWMGFHWFFTFNSTDQGLLQGHLGRSMETQRSVNDTVGDRVLLTFLVSLGTIIFTWVIALPIGIYSAVRQYSVADYVLTFVGFIGMCIPNFLLAILLMYWSSVYFGVNVTGLFSPEFAADPAWSWAKFVDLLKHIWVPVIVIATAGTAGMIRIMRGNLLDELRRPYVTTARAKGVKPFKLLMKYPVRLALNPFISGIGSIFPQLVSGGAIVAIVLSLPMVGPLLLQALMTEDVYLAASMLMILSLLGVLGTLVSDLLLLWLDPRIRMEGGSR